MVTTAYGPTLASYGTTGHHSTIRLTVRLNLFIQPFHNHRPLQRRSTCDMHEWFWATSPLIIFTYLHIHAPPLKGDTTWVASEATPQTMMEITAAFLFLHDTTLDMTETDMILYHFPAGEGNPVHALRT